MTELLNITPPQKKVLEAIADYQKANGGFSPSYTEILEMTGLKGRGDISRYMHILNEKGYIKFSPVYARTANVTKDGLDYLSKWPPA